MAEGLIKNLGIKEVLRIKYEEIQKVYLNDTRPWIVGYSGGKDSTATLQLVYNAIKALPKEKRFKPIYVVSSDTLVENPLIINFIENNIRLINESAKIHDLPITAEMVYPKENETFWTLLIGKGYPTPRQKFRWCTSRLKIDPMDRFIHAQTEKHDEVIVVLGVRRQESASRQRSIDSHTIQGKLLKTHASNPKAYVYAPIEDFDLDDVWNYLLIVPNSWNGNNRTLLSLYRDSSDESECPIQQDKDAPSCGQSRFGCWTCTVVNKDRSLTGFIMNGYDELRPLLEFRNVLLDMRDKEEYRQKWRMNGSIYYVKTADGNKKQGFGPFTLEARKLILKKLLQIEIEMNKLRNNTQESLFDPHNKQTVLLIQPSELKIIRELWIQDGDFEDSLPKMYEEVTSLPYHTQDVEQPILQTDELTLLSQICTEEEISVELIKKLLLIENDFFQMKDRKGILNEIDGVLRQDWIHQDLFILEEGDDDEDQQN